MISKKVCSKCDIEKPVSEFNKHRGRADGYNSICKVCKRAADKKYYSENKEGIKARVECWRKNNPEQYKKYHREYRKTNADEVRGRKRKCRENNPKKYRESDQRKRENNPETYKGIKRKWQKNNLAKTAAFCAKRRASKKQRTPPWLTSEHFKEIGAFYTEAKRLSKETGVEYQVDHIMPLNGENSSGLHVPWNLQVITTEENLKKGSKIL